MSKCRCIPCITEGKQWSPAWKYRRPLHPAGGRTTVAFGFTVSLPALLHTPLHGKEACDGITVLRWRSGRNRKFCSLTGKNWIQRWAFLTPYDQLINCCRCPLAVSEGTGRLAGSRGMLQRLTARCYVNLWGRPGAFLTISLSKYVTKKGGRREVFNFY